ncbi:MAG TPA: tRNA (adenosine(37)-N6)-dimethylallyltransferase MiaA [Candidatus Paceibacterota bacterium]|nr:tRNA (adenosine(37)-N6)-dimethylallyltransferase MiaA [Candidatus Paceibacterota bacterium]
MKKVSKIPPAKMNLPKVVVILGQTATGKSDLAVMLAKKINGEIISADSRQVYKGLDIGSGKITKSEMQGVLHHLLDVASPKRKFTVAEYQKLANIKIKEILKRGKVPIICGGTGFYISAVTDGIVFPEVPPNHMLRKELAKNDTETLYKMIMKLDMKRAKMLDPKNKVRIIRAIEIAKALGKVPKITANKPIYQFVKIGLTLPNNQLKMKINKRLLKRLDEGMLKEVKDLHKNGVSWKRLEELGLEYRYLALFLQKKITETEMIEMLKNEIYHFSMRQMTWFKKDKEIFWIDVSTTNQKNSLKSCMLQYSLE